MLTDKDLMSIQQARDLVNRAAEAQRALLEFSQEQIDRVCAAMSEAVRPEIYRLGELAVAETGYGIAADKAEKNRFAAVNVYEAFKTMKTVGIIAETETIIEMADPRGVVAAIIPTTNPTSTTIYKILISLKARNCIVVSPHPNAARCIAETARIMRDAAVREGLPPDAISWMTDPTIEGTQELMKHRRTAVILATGGLGLVRSAYSSGKPAFGVGPGNVPAFIERSADLEKAVTDILTGKCFDNGTICSSEQAIVADAPIADQVREILKAQGAYFLSRDEINALGPVVIQPSLTVNPKVVGQYPTKIAEMAGFSVPPQTRVLVAELDGVGKEYPLSLEKLSPILAFYTVPDWKAGAELCERILRFGGTGHTLAVHSRDRSVIKAFSLRQPASRIVVNTPAPHGSIGLTTDLSPSMTLGCGSWGGNITSDNISPRHLLDIKRVAFETQPATRPTAAVPVRSAVVTSTPERSGWRIDRSTIEALVEQVLTSRLGRAEEPPAGNPPVPPAPPAAQPATRTENPLPKAVDFVCEDDVKRAIANHQKIYVNSKTIITPAARDLGEQCDVFVRT
ncbi:MAG: aldehyde dehydrogenase family protein [Blastocatellia bacterium]|nr:aldehyde dehydrogenase family protein [Blastocatellia bacterium]